MKGRCVHCRGEFNFGQRDEGISVACPHCGRQTRLSTVRDTPSASEPGGARATQGKGWRDSSGGPEAQRKLAYLESVRANTCYPRLRKLVQFSEVLTVVAGMIMACWGIYTATAPWLGVGGSPGLGFLPPTASLAFGVWQTVIGLASCLFAKAGSEAALLMVDLVDIRIHEQSQKEHQGGATE